MTDPQRPRTDPVTLTESESAALGELVAMLATIEERGLRHDHVIEISRELWRDCVIRPAMGLRRFARITDYIDAWLAGPAGLREARAMVAFTLDTSRYPDDHPIVAARRDLLAWFDAALGAAPRSPEPTLPQKAAALVALITERTSPETPEVAPEKGANR